MDLLQALTARKNSERDQLAKLSRNWQAFLQFILLLFREAGVDEGGIKGLGGREIKRFHKNASSAAGNLLL